MSPVAPSSVEIQPRVVKATAADALGQAVAFNYADLRAACDEHLAGVRARSKRLIEETAVEAERLRREAGEEGRRAGYRDGLKSAEAEVAARVERLAADRLKQQLETVLPAIGQLAETLRMERDRWVARWEQDAVRLAAAIAEKLLRRAILADPSAADGLIAEVLRSSAGSPQLTVRLSPLDYERLGRSLEDVTKGVQQLGEASLVADASVTPGGCLIETRHGRIDGRIETLIDRIAAELSGDMSSEER